MHILNDFHRLLGDISYLRPTTGGEKYELNNLTKTLEEDKDLNNSRNLSAKTERKLASVEKKIRDAHVDHVDPKVSYILDTLPSRKFPSGILMQRKHILFEWIFLPYKQIKKLKTYMKKIVNLILKEKLRLCQLTGMNPEEITVPFTNGRISSSWKENKYGQRTYSNFFGKIKNNYAKKWEN